MSVKMSDKIITLDTKYKYVFVKKLRLIINVIEKGMCLTIMFAASGNFVINQSLDADCQRCRHQSAPLRQMYEFNFFFLFV